MMQKKREILVALFVWIATAVQAQLPGNLARYTQPGVDVQHYGFSLKILKRGAFTHTPLLGCITFPLFSQM